MAERVEAGGDHEGPPGRGGASSVADSDRTASAPRAPSTRTVRTGSAAVSAGACPGTPLVVRPKARRAASPAGEAQYGPGSSSTEDSSSATSPGGRRRCRPAPRRWPGRARGPGPTARRRRAPGRPGPRPGGDRGVQRLLAGKWCSSPALDRPTASAISCTEVLAKPRRAKRAAARSRMPSSACWRSARVMRTTVAGYRPDWSVNRPIWSVRSITRRSGGGACRRPPCRRLRRRRSCGAVASPCDRRHNRVRGQLRRRLRPT